jgi:NAD(P)-dependent dehydrogenase (short-subunit alcohol dehydrogenase family)
VVLITGGSRGLGLALAEAFARRGADIVICARNGAQLDLARRRIERISSGTRVLAQVCDVTDRAQVEGLIAATTERFGRLDVLVNNAGTIAVGPFRAQTVEDFEMTLDVMYRGVLYPTFAALPPMRARGEGRIVNITSIGGRAPVPHLSSYTGAKFGAVGLSNVLAAELAREGISVLTVVPGLMRTGSYRYALYKGKAETEYGLFSVVANLPLLTMAADVAAERIVRALENGDRELTLTAAAKALARFHGLAPALSTDVMGLANRLLPTADGPTPLHLGAELENAVSQSPLTALGQQAVQDYQHGGIGGGGGAAGWDLRDAGEDRVVTGNG